MAFGDQLHLERSALCSWLVTSCDLQIEGAAGGMESVDDGRRTTSCSEAKILVGESDDLSVRGPTLPHPQSASDATRVISIPGVRV